MIKADLKTLDLIKKKKEEVTTEGMGIGNDIYGGKSQEQHQHDPHHNGH